MPGVNRQFRWSRLVSKVFDLKGAAPDLQVLDDVLPVAPLYDATDVEHHFGRDEQLFSVYAVGAAGGLGTFSCAGVSCRPGHIVVVEAIGIIGVNAGRNYQLHVNGGLVGTLTTPTVVPLDMRFESLVSGGCIGYQGTFPSSPPANVFAQYAVAANVVNFFPVGVVLDQDDNFGVVAVTANEAIYCNIMGYVRRAEASEVG